MDNRLVRDIPNINSLLEHPLLSGMERERVKSAAQELTAQLRGDILSGAADKLPSLDCCAEMILSKLNKGKVPSLRGVVNATGVVLHTNLGRAPLGAELYDLAAAVYGGYCNLEYNLDTGRRGSRHAHVEELICRLTGAQAAMVVNNNAAAVFLMLAAIARGKQVAISRGELVEIGGSFRVPDIMEQSGAQLAEVGTTNKTRLSDYLAAVQNGAEVLLKVHTSNYEIVGFTESVTISDLAALGRGNGLPVLYDMGSCFLFDPHLPWLHKCTTARDGITDGADIICFSGDKLLGSTQAGIIAGREDLISIMKKHPLARTMRPDKLTLQALEAALDIYLYPDEAMRRIPTLSMLSASADELRQRALDLHRRLLPVCGSWEVTVRDVDDETGGGSLPNVFLEGSAVAIKPSNITVSELEKRLRDFSTPVITRVNDGAVLISVRTLLPGDDDIVISALSSVCASAEQ